MALIRFKNGSYIETINAKDTIHGRRLSNKESKHLIELEITKAEMCALDALKQLEKDIKTYDNNFCNQ